MHRSTRGYRLFAPALALGLYGLAAPSFAQTLTTLHNFTGYSGNLDGEQPSGSVILGSDGNLYGTASYGGANNTGTIFKISPSTGQFTVLHTFGSESNNTDGENPASTLVQGPDGNFYGTAQDGGSGGGGTAFVITPGGTFTVLHSFGRVQGFGETPLAGLALGSDGNYYGTTTEGGTNGSGSIYRVTPGGSYTLLYSFSTRNSSGDNADGAAPAGTLVLGSNGDFYGTAEAGGSGGAGVVFQFSPSSSQLTNLHSFDVADGSLPFGALVQDGSGVFYGLTLAGGNNPSGDFGTLFRITSSGAYNRLFIFNDSTSYGGSPAGLTLGKDGNLYGVTGDGGANYSGTIFRATTSGSVSTLYSFTAVSGVDNVGGSLPQGPLVESSSGVFYGAAEKGGQNGEGTVFEFTP